jgi:hypothetical protein
MIELTPGAQSRLDDYLNELRRVLSGSPSVDSAEVERDIRDHIDAALAGQAAPIEAFVLDDVLQTLGSPSQWLPEAESAWFRRSPARWPALFKQALLRVGRRLAGGPESYRLAYLSLLVLGLGWYLMPSGRLDEVIFGPMIATLFSFILSRAALALFGAERLSAGQKWLLYPALLAVYLPVAALMFLGPVAIAGLNAIKSDLEFGSARQRWESLNEQVRDLDRRIERDRDELQQAETSGLTTVRGVDEIKKSLAGRISQREAAVQELENHPPYPRLWNVSLNPIKMTCGLTAVAGASWFLIGLLWTLLPGLIRNAFYPFVAPSSRRSGFALAALGLLMSLGGVLFFL